MFKKKSKETEIVADVNKIYSDQEQLLNDLFIHCVQKNSVELAELMLQQGADINYIKRTALKDPYITGEQVYYIREGPVQFFYESALQLAFYNKNIKMLKLLLEKGVKHTVPHLNNKDLVKSNLTTLYVSIELKDLLEKYVENIDLGGDKE